MCLQFQVVSLNLGEQDALNIAKTTPSSGSGDKVIFDNVKSTATSGFDVKCMCIPSQKLPLFSCLYWAHLAADVTSCSKALLRLKNS